MSRNSKPSWFNLPEKTPHSLEQCIAAVRGEGLPDNLDTAVARAAVVRGIRSHHNFAVSPAVTKLCNDATTLHPQFTRAQNARLIMSNVIPDNMYDISSQPYCIWYPEFATEETYRKLAKAYPGMRYQVGRACAAAGYAALYTELDLLPDVSIAEEARESEAGGSLKIFLAIMAAPFKYAVLNDYTRSVDLENPKFPAYLNADTAVRSYLECRSKDFTNMTDLVLVKGYWDVEEDRCINGYELGEPGHYGELSTAEKQFLYNPLPNDLPTLNKDLLILMAAYDGNIDRYVRLHRPFLIETEVRCVLRGIYHHTMFARWWSQQLEQGAERLSTYRENHIFSAERRIQMAVNARRIMNNDTSRFSCEEFAHPCQPYMIWWPVKPHSHTLDVLANRCPHMKEQIVLASIICDYPGVYDQCSEAIQPNAHMWIVASRSHNQYYLQDLEKRATELGLEIRRPGYRDRDGSTDTIADDPEPSSTILIADIGASTMDVSKNDEYDHGPYFGQRTGAAMIERHVWATPELLRKLAVASDYSGWLDGEVNTFLEAEIENEALEGHESD